MQSNIKYANQSVPYKLMKKHFKTRKDKEYILNFYKIIKKNCPFFTDKDIIHVCLNLSEEGCTYASMANSIIKQFEENLEYLEEKLGYKLINSDGLIEADKLMVDIFSCLSSMIELDITTYKTYKFDSIIEAANNFLNDDFNNENDAIIKMHELGIIMDGIDENGKLIFKNIRNPICDKYFGTYQELALILFNINNPSINKEDFELLLKKHNKEYRIKDDLLASKFSGLGSVKISNISKWTRKFFEMKKMDEDIEIDVINLTNYNITYEEFVEKINNRINDNYSILVSALPELEVWMSDGKTWEKSSNKFGHRMDYMGFDDYGNIMLCSWGTKYTVPKEFFEMLEFTLFKVHIDKNKMVK